MVNKSKNSMQRAAVLLVLSLSPAAGLFAQPNFLVILGDDMGVETLGMYGYAEETASTPTLDALAAQGVRFERFWSQPVCSPTRATIMTGRYGFRTGVLTAIPPGWTSDDIGAPLKAREAPKEVQFTPVGPVAYEPGRPMPPGAGGFPGGGQRPPGLRPDEVTLPQVLKSMPARYETAAFGKWHLSDANNGEFDHPNLAGFDHFSGPPFGGPESFFAWRHNVNGEISAATGYADSRSVEDALDWINDRGEQPWFVWFSFINPHVPAHLPPTDLLHSDLAQLDPEAVSIDNTFPYFLAQIEAMDTLIGQLLDGIPEESLDETYVLFLGDNGTVEWVFPRAPVERDRAKATLFNGGIHVPFIVSGPAIEGGRIESALTNTTDLFATIIELAGGDPEAAVPTQVPIDSVSFAPLLLDPGAPDHRTWIYADMNFRGQRQRTIRNDSYKLIRSLDDGSEWFFDLSSDPWEHEDLIDRLDGDTRRNYDALTRELESLTRDSASR